MAQTPFIEPVRPEEILISEANGRRSRDIDFVAPSQNILPGAVLGRLAATGRLVAYDPDATTGAERVAGIALTGATTGASTTAEIVILARDAEIKSSLLVFGAGVSSAERATAIVALADLGIIAR